MNQDNNQIGSDQENTESDIDQTSQKTGNTYNTDINNADYVAIGDKAKIIINKIKKPFEIPTEIAKQNPYLGLKAFEYKNRNIFFGREALIEDCLRCWRSNEKPFLALLGASGSGKSSLAQAGILPRLVDKALEHGKTLQWCVFRPGNNPLQLLKKELISIVSLPNDFDDLLLAHPQALAELLPTPSNSDRLIIIVDQFEELLVECKDEPQQQVFVAALLYAVEAGKIGLILTIRTDFADKWSAYSRLNEWIFVSNNHRFITPMSSNELTSTIKDPVKKFKGLEFEGGLVEQMIKDVDQSRSNKTLPLLQVCLERLWEKGELSLQAYSEIGGVQGSLRQKANELFSDLSSDEQRALESLLLRLIYVSADTEPSRRKRTLASLIPASDPTGTRTETLVKKLVDARLIVIDDPWAKEQSNLGATRSIKDSDATVEIIHEALINSWERLSDWVRKLRDEHPILVRLNDVAQYWEQSGCERGTLYRGKDLDYAEQLRTADYELTKLEIAFIDTSLAQRAREQRQGRIAMAITGVALLAVCVLAGIFINPYFLLVRAYTERSMVLLKGGEMVFGAEQPDPASELPLRHQDIQDFWMDVTEVSNRQYARCVQAGWCITTPGNWSRQPTLAYDDKPVTEVDFQQASDYCTWLGRRLPTEAEWERAARGLEGHNWPWGNEPPQGKRINIGTSGSWSVTQAGDDISEEGILNLAGNVREWTQTYENCPPESCFLNSLTASRITRGWSWEETEKDLIIVSALLTMPRSSLSSDRTIGFRCVSSTTYGVSFFWTQH